MWIRLKSIQRVDRQGRLMTYHPGDWIDVGKQMANLWLSRGEAEIPTFKRHTAIIGDAGVVIRAAVAEPFQAQFNMTQLELVLTVGEPNIAFGKTLIWNPKTQLRTELISAGFGMLETWEIAVPLYSYDELAVHIGSEEDRKRTKAIIRDLRVPVFHTGLMFVRDCENTQKLFDAWTEENGVAGESDERLSFMRAYYKVKPLMLALPATWHDQALYADAA